MEFEQLVQHMTCPLERQFHSFCFPMSDLYGGDSPSRVSAASIGCCVVWIQLCVLPTGISILSARSPHRNSTNVLKMPVQNKKRQAKLTRQVLVPFSHFQNS
jgi:hypothetical protein